MHAGSILFLWVVVALFVQQAEGWSLVALTAASLTVALACARVQCMQLLARVRVFLLAILVLFAWFTPGEAVFMDWPRAGPSREGLLFALTHAGRLVALVCWVAVLVGRMPTDRLVSGLYALARPCRVFGLPAERIALRLLLVLRHVSAARGDGHWRDWRAWLNPPAANGIEAVHLMREHLSFKDIALPAMVCIFLAFWWLR
ncbi:MAG: energy-coupling factor transporter transmembrane protein EcfT [Betaproteobacteria bacterium]|nr:energy-coupling factor transporter transmembrane protein EcfT [Betaproteobacteria bacterium]